MTKKYQPELICGDRRPLIFYTREMKKFPEYI